MTTRVLALIAVTALPACTGITFGENLPGEDTYMDDDRPPSWTERDEDGNVDPDGPAWDEPVTDPDLPCRTTGSFAVDHRTDVAYVLQSYHDVSCDLVEYQSAPAEKVLYAVDPDGVRLDPIDDFTGYDDVRMLFPRDQVMVMAQERSGEELLGDEIRFYDPVTWEQTNRVYGDAWYHGTRMSGSRRFVAAADNFQDSAPIHIIDTESLDIVEFPHDADWLEAMWTHGDDRLVAALFYDQFTEDARARVLVYEFASDGPAPLLQQQPDETGVWSAPSIDVWLDDTNMDYFFSFTWLAVSPDDRYVAVPARRSDDSGGHITYLVSLETGDVRSVDGVRGPLGVTPDGSTFVGYGGDGEDMQLALIDPVTLEIDWIDVPDHNAFTYFVTREGNYVVIAPNFGRGTLVLHDIDSDATTSMGGPEVDLREFVSRPGAGEIWIVDSGLFRLDLHEPDFGYIDIDFRPSRIHHLPNRDLLILNDIDEPVVRLYDPTAREVERVIRFPIEVPQIDLPSLP